MLRPCANVINTNSTPAYAGCGFQCPLRYLTLTTSTKETLAYPPAQIVPDTIAFVKQVDWADVRQRCRGGVNNVGIVLAVVGEKIHDIGAFLAQV